MRRRALLAALAAWTAGCQRGSSGEAPQANPDDAALVDQDGQEVRWGDLKGRPRALFFGFTHCPVICPVTVFELTDALKQIGSPPIAIEFITVDPERDTPARLKQYLSSFGPGVRGFTGAPESIARIARHFEVVYRRTPLDNGGYTMDHTATVFLLDAAGAQRDVVAYGSPPELVQTRLRALGGAA